MQNREGLSHGIECRAGDLFKALVPVESDRLWVLFIDIDQVGAEVFDGMLEQGTAYALAASPAVNKQHLYLVVCYAQKADNGFGSSRIHLSVTAGKAYRGSAA